MQNYSKSTDILIYTQMHLFIISNIRNYKTSNSLKNTTFALKSLKNTFSETNNKTEQFVRNKCQVSTLFLLIKLKLLCPIHRKKPGFFIA